MIRIKLPNLNKSKSGSIYPIPHTPRRLWFIGLFFHVSANKKGHNETENGGQDHNNESYVHFLLLPTEIKKNPGPYTG